VIEPLKYLRPVFAYRYIGRPDLVDPANACFAVVFPPIDGVDVKKIPVILANGDEQIVFLSEANLLEPGVPEEQTPWHVSKQKSSLPFVSKSKTPTRLKPDRIDVIYLEKNILGFVKAALESLSWEISTSRHADPRLRRVFQRFGASSLDMVYTGPAHLITYSVIQPNLRPTFAGTAEESNRGAIFRHLANPNAPDKRQIEETTSLEVKNWYESTV
jgi:hypothetical protein